MEGLKPVGTWSVPETRLRRSVSNELEHGVLFLKRAG